jgi:hypothetical protein
MNAQNSLLCIVMFMLCMQYSCALFSDIMHGTCTSHENHHDFTGFHSTVNTFNSVSEFIFLNCSASTSAECSVMLEILCRTVSCTLMTLQ